MTFDRIARLLKRGNREGDKDIVEGASPADAAANVTRHALPVADTDPDQARDRRELGVALDHGFSQVAGAMDRLNQHLRQNGDLMTSLQETHSQLPALIQSQLKVSGLVANAERGNQAVLQTLVSHLKQRDEAQQAVVRLLGQLNTAVIDQRTANQDQVKLVTRLHNSNRRVLLGLLLVFMLCALLLFGLVLVLAIRPELLHRLGGGPAIPPPTTSAVQPPASVNAPVPPVVTWSPVEGAGEAAHVVAPAPPPVAPPAAPVLPRPPAGVEGDTVR